MMFPLVFFSKKGHDAKMKKDHIVTPWGLTQSPVGVKQGAI